MQQTEKWKLNLIDRDDPFTPDALNENTKQLEKVLSEQLATKGTISAYRGSYEGDGKGTGRDIELGFAPKLLFLWGWQPGIATPGWSIYFNNTNCYTDDVKLTETGFHLSSTHQNTKGTTVNYLAFA